MRNLKQLVVDFFRAMIPVERKTIYDHRAAPAALASFMDVDRIHAIFAEAEAGNTSDLFALYRDVLLADSHLQGEFGKRKLAILGDVFSVQPADKKNAQDVAAAAFIEDQLKSCPKWLFACSHLLDSTLWPVAVVEKIFAPEAGGYRLKHLVPVPDQLLDFTNGCLRLRATDPATGYPTGEFFQPDESRYIVHRGHLLGTADNWGGPMRSLIFWWFFSAMDRDSWARFIDRFGAPFLVGKYDQADDASRTILERAFSNATRLFGIVISTDTAVEIQQAASQPTGQAFELFLTIAQREKSKLIVGQTTSAEAQATGLGSGVADQQENVRNDIRALDILLLQMTLGDQLVEQLMRINGRVGARPRLVWGSESKKESQLTGTLLQALAQAGLQIADESLPSLSDKLGFVIERAATPARPGLPLNAGQLFALASGLQFGQPFRADAAMDSIARDGAADLARAFRGTFAPVRRMILESESADDLETRLRAFSAGWSPAQASRLLADGLAAFGANGAVITDR